MIKPISLILITLTSFNLWANEYLEVCSAKMENAAIFHFAQQQGVYLSMVTRVRFTMGPWTEAVGNNSGSAEVAMRLGGKTTYRQVFAQQIGTTGDCNVTSVEELKVEDIDPLAVEAEKYKIAIGNEVTVTSEADFPWETFYSHEVVGEDFAIADVRRALRVPEQGDDIDESDKIQVEVWTHKEVIAMLDEYADFPDECPAYHEEEYRYKALKHALLKDFTELRAYKVGVPDSGAQDFYLVGRTKKGNLVGLRSIKVET